MELSKSCEVYGELVMKLVLGQTKLVTCSSKAKLLLQNNYAPVHFYDPLMIEDEYNLIIFKYFCRSHNQGCRKVQTSWERSLGGRRFPAKVRDF